MSRLADRSGSGRAAFHAEEHRLQLRFPVPTDEEVSAFLDAPDARAEARVVDLSLSGAGLVVASPHMLARPRHVSLGLRWSERFLGEIPIDLVHAHSAGGGAPEAQVVGVRFRGYSEPFLQGLCRYLLDRHSQPPDRPGFLAQPPPCAVASDPKHVRRLLAHCCRRRRPLRLFELSGKPLGEFRPRTLDERHVRGGLELPRGEVLRGEASYLLVLPSFTSVYLAQAMFLEGAGEHAVFTMPEQVIEAGFRRTGRLAVPADFAVYFEFLHPQVPGRLIRKRTREVGLGGLSFELNIEDDLLVTGTLIDSGMLRLPDGRSLSCRGVVRHTFWTVSGRYCCGVELLDFSGRGREVWAEQVLEHLNPGVVEATPFSLDDVWGVFERSGYLEEKPAGELARMREPFTDTWRALLSARQDARFWIHTGAGRTEGTISVSRIYQSSWMVHHLSVDEALPPARKLLVLADLGPRTALQWLAAAHPGANVVIFYDASRSFNVHPYLNFFSRHLHTGLVELRPLRLHEYAPKDAPAASTVEEIRCGPASTRDLHWISQDLLQRDGALTHRAMDYSPETLLLEHLRSAPATEVLRRERAVLVAEREDQVLAYALVESAAIGVNIFSLYHTLRIISCVPASEKSLTVAWGALFAAAAAWHAARRAPSFLCLQAEDDGLAPQARARFEAAAMRVVVAAALIPGWVRLMNDLWAHR